MPLARLGLRPQPDTPSPKLRQQTDLVTPVRAPALQPAAQHVSGTPTDDVKETVSAQVDDLGGVDRAPGWGGGKEPFLVHPDSGHPLQTVRVIDVGVGVVDHRLVGAMPTHPKVGGGRCDLVAVDIDHAARGGDERPISVQVFDLATDLLREADPPPELRAAVVQVLARLPVRLVNQTSQTITIEITYKTPLATRDTITLTLEGELLAETSTFLEANSELGIPANTVVLSVDYQETRITDDLWQSTEAVPADDGNPTGAIGE